jgi:ERCC4-type nuclease
MPFGYKRSKKKGDLVSTVGPFTFEFDFPDGMILICDTREQTPLFLPKSPKGLVIVRDTLKYGDYSLKGWEDMISIERKNLDDLWSSVTVDADRFKRELVELSKYERKWILVEGTEAEALRPDLGGRSIHPNSIRGALTSIQVRAGIPIYFGYSRSESERWVLDIFSRYYKWKRGI